MSIGSLDGISAYARAMRTTNPLSDTGQKVGSQSGGLAPSGGLSPGGGFGAMVEGMVSQTGDALRNAETQSIKQIGGKGDLIDVVTAIGAAETALDTVVAVRDRVVSAYSDIMKMQI
ncbi:flagellar hook-basal body complex protein FliE [Novosphingobium guangzhouense]|uniref:Flagellar hook-basal body complex protein FliE n=1 Tax=Novosphingobium guangzhouense TaxID=1850347 RepID=A0A2K2FVF3_9SPHN|nr:flagellar hook-basal body complex protein FliE [Novosphingobium guangzhouense]PNU02730.1 flagellar hook-basal body protein FliE [Novosphingobium guangzhouense]